MKPTEIKQAAVALAIIFLVAAAGWLLIGRGDSGSAGGKLSDADAQQQAQDPSLLAPQIAAKAKVRRKGLLSLQRAEGRLTGPVYFNYLKATSQDTGVLDLDGNTSTAPVETAPASATLRLKFARRPSSQALTKVLGYLFADAALKVSADGRRMRIRSAKIVSVAFVPGKREVRVRGLYLKSACAKVKRFPLAYELRSACGLEPKPKRIKTLGTTTKKSKVSR